MPGEGPGHWPGAACSGLRARAASESASVSAKYAWPCSSTNTPRRVSSFIVRVMILCNSYFARHDAGDIAWHARSLHDHVASLQPVVRARPSPLGEGLQVLVYSPDRPDLFARICGYFDSAAFNILDAKVHTTRAGFALDTFQVISPQMDEPHGGHYRDLISYVETQLAKALTASGALPEPSRGRMSRRVKSFPITPCVTLRPDERGQRWLLGVSSSDRSGLLYAIARVLARHHINLQLAKITTLGERVEDTFIVDGAVLQHNRAQIEIESELLDAITA